MTATVHHGEALAALKRLPDNCIAAVVTDPPYGLGKLPDMEKCLRAWLAGESYSPGGKGFMGKDWDSFVPGPELWREVFRVMKPGAHAAVFAGTRTADLMGLALRLAGFEIRDSVAWIYGSGFPKSLDLSKAIDQHLGTVRPVVGFDAAAAARRTAKPDGTRLGVFAGQSGDVTAAGTPEAAAWDGWGTALKPGHEPILIVRKPLIGTVAANVLAHGTGGIHVDAGRIDGTKGIPGSMPKGSSGSGHLPGIGDRPPGPGQDPTVGRWPANVAMDEAAAADLDATVGNRPGMSGGGQHTPGARSAVAFGSGDATADHLRADNGGPSRFFYCAKASRSEREAGLDHLPTLGVKDLVGREEGSAGSLNPRAGAGARAGGRRNAHPTVKPIAIMRWLVRMLAPPGATVLDPFGGSGTTGIACVLEGFDALLIEREASYVEIARARIAHAAAEKETGK